MSQETPVQGSKYFTVTELPGLKASREQIERLFHRYHFAAQFCTGKEVLEVACGSGIGLGYLAKNAVKVIGGDIDENNLAFARERYKGRQNIEIKQLDAHQLPFDNGSFDAVIFYEAIYYLKDPEKFVSEAHRVLRKGGAFLFCTVNKDWTDFNPSPYSTKYFSIPELNKLFGNFGNVNFFGAFRTTDDTTRGKIISMIKRLAVSLHIIPRTMKGKELLKRIFFGRLQILPSEVTEGMAEYSLPVHISSSSPNPDFKVIYAVGYAG
ncbi:hypothetical protein COS16_05700 [Candidatus Desantisbacteria bacterium CG02_land_8_20_14_3_00_49_13]|nr:MAG: hypothetical protein COS16_05700 [Candidatus Desantisbacteria bacterium CG02_land_8_20_14_3_00_49_13]